jgi:NADPH:quinone reductase-like Zn-dependent oxidoreductase
MSLIVRIHRTGGPEVLELEEHRIGDPGIGELRVRIEAIGLNRSEAAYRQGTYPIPPRLPSLMGYEAAGIVEAAGPGAEPFVVGERVCILPTFRLGEYGVYGEQAIVPVRSALSAPSQLSATQAAAIWMPYLTAMALVEIAKIGLGDHVLIPAASSSVGLAATQLARWAGAVPIAVTRHSSKTKALESHGASHVIASAECDLVEAVMRITEGRGARVVFDPVGGSFVTTLAQAMAEEGILFQYGGLSGESTPYPHWPAAFRGLSVRGWVASSIWNKPERFERAKMLILRGLAGGHLRPIIDRVFPLRQIVDAHRHLESNQQIGKIVVTP